jgi:hypothetical protein
MGNGVGRGRRRRGVGVSCEMHGWEMEIVPSSCSTKEVYDHGMYLAAMVTGWDEEIVSGAKYEVFESSSGSTYATDMYDMEIGVVRSAENLSSITVLTCPYISDTRIYGLVSCII